jgi:hypothetical protein
VEISVVVACKLMWQNMRTCQTVIISPNPNIKAKLLLVSRMDYTIRILPYPLVFIVNTDDAKLNVETYYLMMAKKAKT